MKTDATATCLSKTEAAATYLTTASVAGKLNIDGTNSMTGALNMGTTNKIINLATPTSNTDAVTKLCTNNANALKLNFRGGKMSGILDMNFNSISNVTLISSSYNVRVGAEFRMLFLGLMEIRLSILRELICIVKVVLRQRFKM